MNSLIWKYHRFRAMGLNEVGYRIKQTLFTKLESHGIGLLINPPEPIQKSKDSKPILFSKKFNLDPYLVSADRILDGYFDVFALESKFLGFPPRWNKDPLTGIEPQLTFGKTLNYRDEKQVGNIKYLWEPNRHLELVTLAQAWHLTGDKKYADGCKLLLDSWFQQCPYPLGPNWTSSLEHSVRLVNWAFAWHLLGGDQSPLFQNAEGEQFRQRWLGMIYRHCHFIAGHFSKYSSANNHLLGEYMGLLVGSLTWPLWQESLAWQTIAYEGFGSEALKQNTIDGVNREQAVWYHHEVADMMLICALIGRANGLEFSSDYWARLEAMLNFISAVMDVGGNVPMIGDSDDAVMVRFSREGNFHPYRSLLATGAVLFAREDFKTKSGFFEDKSRWLLGDQGEMVFQQLPISSENIPRCRSFSDGGYYVLGDSWESDQEIRMVVDVGPLGYLSIAAHGHADALAFTLSVSGQELLIDPGTYAYHTQKLWRDYFRGTSAHNTVRVDGVDQSVIGGNFMWLKQAVATFHSWESNPQRDSLLGSHDGYLRLDDPLLHTREIVLDKSTREIFVKDFLNCKGSHRIEIFWHCHEDAKVTLHNAFSATIERDSVKLLISVDDPRFAVSMKNGEENPPLGWVSRAFDKKIATPTLVWAGDVQGDATIETKFRVFQQNLNI